MVYGDKSLSYIAGVKQRQPNLDSLPELLSDISPYLIMKIFTLRATTEEQKGYQKMQTRLWAVFFISMIFILGTFAIYLQITEQKIHTFSDRQFLFYLAIIGNLINMAPNIMKYSWKQIIIQSIVISIFMGLFYSFLFGFLWP